MPKTREEALEELYKKSPPRKAEPEAKKASMAENYKSLGEKMMESGRRAGLIRRKRNRTNDA